jgi:hypothetical protein
MATDHPIYDYFSVNNDNSNNKVYKCNEKWCGTPIKWCSSPSNLIKHLKLHLLPFSEYQKKMINYNYLKRKSPEHKTDEVQAIPASKRHARDAQSSIINCFNNITQVNLHDAMARAFVMNGWSIRATECKHFHDFLSQFKQEKHATIPSRHVLREAIIRNHKSMKIEVVSRLKRSKIPVSLLLDGWTNVRKEKITNLLLVSKGIAYYWCSISNKDSKNTAEWLYNNIKPEIDNILDHGIPIVSYVADNEQVMNALHDKLVVDFPFLVRIPCAAHTIQLAVHKILGDATFKSLIKELLALINMFISNKPMRLLLHNAQPKGKGYKLIRPCDTRWSYTLVAIKRLLKLRNYIDQSLIDGSKPQQSASFWGQLHDLTIILKPFSDATDVIQQDSATLNDVGVQFRCLENHAKSLEQKHPNISNHILNCIHTQWTEHINDLATIATAILAAKPNISTIYQPAKIIQAQNFILNWGAIYLEYYRFINCDNVKHELTSQFVEFTGKTDRFAGFYDRIKATTKVITADEVKREITTPIAVWESFRDGAFELTSVAIAILSICASEAAVERSFSLQDRIHSKSRNKSNDELVEAQMFIKFNTQAMASSPKVEAADAVEITPETEVKPVELEFLNDENVGHLIEEEQEQQQLMQDEDEEDLQHSDDSDKENDSNNNNNNNNNNKAASPEEITAFVHRYIEQHHLTKGARLFGDNENALLNAMAENKPRILTNIVDIKKMVKTLAPVSY